MHWFAEIQLSKPYLLHRPMGPENFCLYTDTTGTKCPKIRNSKLNILIYKQSNIRLCTLHTVQREKLMLGFSIRVVALNMWRYFENRSTLVDIIVRV